MHLTNFNFNDVYHQHNLLVYNLALSYLHNAEDAEEVTQDVFIKIFESLHKFEDKSTIKTWIYRITINHSLDFLRKKKSKKRFFIFGKKSENELEIRNHSDFEHPGILLENKEDAKILFTAIGTLPENQQTAFILSKVDGLKNQEIAEIMQLSISSIESLVFRARNNLKEILAIKFEEYRKKK